MGKEFTEQDSLRVINEMINQARNNFRKGAGSYSIFWGYFIAGIAIMNLILLHIFTNNDINTNYAGYTWWITFPTGIIYFFYAKNKAKQSIVATHIDRIIAAIWIAFAISCFVFIIVLSLCTSNYETRYMGLIITPTILLLLGMGQFISATALKFKFYFYAAGIFWLGSILCIILSAWTGKGEIHYIVLAICMILGFCIPGHMLNKKAKGNV